MLKRNSCVPRNELHQIGSLFLGESSTHFCKSKTQCTTDKGKPNCVENRTFCITPLKYVLYISVIRAIYFKKNVAI